MIESTVTLGDAIEITENLSPADQLRLVSAVTDRLSRGIEQTLDFPQPDVPDAEALEQAITLYRQDRVTLGRAAEMAGLTRWELAHILQARGTPVVVDVPSAEEMDRDLVACLG